MNRRWAATGLALLAGVIAGAALVAAPAFAHAQLVGTTPANGARLDSAPAEIVLRFSERVNLLRDGIRLLDAAGADHAGGPARVDASGRDVTLPVQPGLSNGAFIVSWRVVSADSHPIHGAFTFGVGDITVTPLPDAGAGSTVDPGLTATYWVLRWLGYAGLALLLGGALFLLVCWPPGWYRRRSRHLLLAGWATSALAALGSLVIQGPYASGGTLRSVADPGLLAATWGTDYGRFVAGRLQLLALAGVLLVFLARRPATDRPRWTIWAAAVLGVALPATWIGTGHANAESNPLAWAADAVHLAAMAAWFGGLVFLVAAVLPQATDGLALAVTRFSRIATICVGLLVVTGTYQAWRGVGSLAALAGSDYGRLLVFKLAAVGVLLWFGWTSRTVVHKHYASALSTSDTAVAQPVLAAVGAPRSRVVPRGPSRSARKSERATRERESHARRQLRWSVWIEVAIGVAVLALTSLLVATPPGARPAAATPAAATASPSAAARPEIVATQLALDGGGRLYVQLQPARAGNATLSIAVQDSSMKPWDVPEVSAALRLAAQDLGPLPVKLRQVRPGDYVSEGLVVPMPGTWQLQVKVRTSEIDQIMVDTALTIY